MESLSSPAAPCQELHFRLIWGVANQSLHAAEMVAMVTLPLWIWCWLLCCILFEIYTCLYQHNLLIIIQKKLRYIQAAHSGTPQWYGSAYAPLPVCRFPLAHTIPKWHSLPPSFRGTGSRVPWWRLCIKKLDSKKNKTAMEGSVVERISLWLAHIKRALCQNLKSGQSRNDPCAGYSWRDMGRLGSVRRRKGREEGVIGGARASPYLHAGRAEPCGP